MSSQFFEHPIINSPYAYPDCHWELDDQGQPTQQVVESRRRADFFTPIPKPKKRKGSGGQAQMQFGDELGVSTQAQQYDPTSIINELRTQVDQWRQLPNTNDWLVTPETARLLQHWRHHDFQDIRPFFCQVEAIETLIWLTEVAPKLGKRAQHFLDHIEGASEGANPSLLRTALKLATGAGKTTVMAMIISWQTVNAARRPNSKKFTRGFLVVTPGLTIRDRLNVQQHEDGSSNVINGRLELFRNFDDYDNPLPRPNTLLIDSEQLESGESLDKNFRKMAGDEIELFKREIIERTGDPRAADNITDQDLLREVMNTVGKQGRLGESIRCVVSVSMLTEGWDANTVTHVLGVRAFGTQLLCEQVIGRALRRQSYDVNEQGRFNVEYADVLGIPFDFTAEPVVAKPQPPRETIQVKAVRPDRDDREIRFPHVEGYRVELPEERLTAQFNNDSTLQLTPELVGPSKTRNEGIIGEAVDLDLVHTGDLRQSTLLFHLTQRLINTKWRNPGEEPKVHLFGQLKRITRQWLDNYLECKGGTYPAQLMYPQLADIACDRITAAITRSETKKERPVKAVLDSYNPTGSTAHVSFNTSKTNRWKTAANRCHINWAILDSEWEGEFCRVAESHDRVISYAKNHNLGLEVPYRYASEVRKYIPDFIVLVDDGHGKDDPLHLIVEIKGYRGEDAKEKKSTMDTYWVPGVNHLGTHGRWAFAECTDVYEMQDDFAEKVANEFKAMIEAQMQESMA